MSYAIIRNDKLTRGDAQGSYIHNDRRSKGHSNKDIDPTRTHLNFWCKKNELTYIKEFDKLKKEYDLKGIIRSNSIIMCEMIITSDNAFFNKIGLAETKRYFKESYKFVCDYKNLGEKYIVSATVHLDEMTPHMHLIFLKYKAKFLNHNFQTFVISLEYRYEKDRYGFTHTCLSSRYSTEHLPEDLTDMCL